MVDALQMVRYKATAEIVSSFHNYTKKYEEGQKEFFAAMIIRVLLHDKLAIHPSDIQTVINIIQAGEEEIMQEIREQMNTWRATRKTEKELDLSLAWSEYI